MFDVIVWYLKLMHFPTAEAARAGISWRFSYREITPPLKEALDGQLELCASPMYPARLCTIRKFIKHFEPTLPYMVFIPHIADCGLIILPNVR